MRYYLLFIISLGLFMNTSSAQSLPIIHATSDMIDIREGDEYEKGAWRVMPEYRPDVFTSNKIGEQVTFYTDMDSISFVIEPNVEYDFIVLLNGKDSAYTRIRYEPSYLDKLKKAKLYGSENKTVIPPFTYQDSSDPNLMALREGFNLDSIAGTGNEVSRILNLMHWIHDLIPHDGNHENPTVKNAMSMIDVCKKDARGLNCRGLATVLNECYLSMGIPSRIVTCMPRDSIFQDCHVINTVFSKDLGKWIWIDPTHDAYVLDANGRLLGLEEVRGKLINGDMVILNPDANWNNRSSTVKEYYLLEYMAKNLYRFSSPLHSRYDFETNEKGKTRAYVELLPLDGLNQLPKFKEETSRKSGVVFKTYKTNNPEVFWAKPGEVNFHN